MEDFQALTRIAELEAKLEILQGRFDRVRAIVTQESDRLDDWMADDRERRDSVIDDWDISEVHANLQAALSI